ncbi:MAG: cold shock domain-containing protein [Proteobacteria bacterium]|nr:cold shock domain-containing protein [Pseudomonadota bacterium]MBU4297850.1 cold shock domain-containing protein [Pseudomonadota bacterium]MCG2746216.1 cold shock domain-containing protein [Desulfobulbaceae bacterium]
MELKVEGRNLEVRKSWQDRIEEEKERLMRHHPGLILNLRVTIEETTSHKQGGYEVRLVTGVPNDTVVVKRKGDSVAPLLVEAFDTLGLQLKELQRKRRQTSKVPEAGGEIGAGLGVIKRLSPYESYGFIFADDGREIYFHENALKDLVMDQLAEGDAVSFGVTEGHKGPQATWVRTA